MTTFKLRMQIMRKRMVTHFILNPFGGRSKEDECFGWTCYFRKGENSEELIGIEIEVKKVSC